MIRPPEPLFASPASRWTSLKPAGQPPELGVVEEVHSSADVPIAKVRLPLEETPTSVTHVRPSDQPLDASRQIRTSVLVNTHNQGAFIEDCVDSLLVQTQLPDEIIVYDDASDDDTVERLRRYGNRIILIEGEPRTVPSYIRQAEAVLAAFRRSTGQLVFLLDGDDRFKRDKVSRYAQVLMANPGASLIQAPMEKIDEHGRIIGTNIEPRKHVSEPLKAIYREQDVDFFYPTSALAFSRDFLTSALPLDFSDGLELWLDTRLSVIAPHFGPVITLPDVFTDWRRHIGSHSIRTRSRDLQIRQTLMRTRVFNRFCRRHGLPTISPWRNTRFYLQLIRYSLPDSAYSLFHRRFRGRGSSAQG